MKKHTYWDEQIATRISNSPQRAVALLQKEDYIMIIPRFTRHTWEGHWSMVAPHLNINNKVCFYHFDSLNRFDDMAPHSLSNTPLYTPQTDTWKNVQTMRQTELESGMRVCMAASVIAEDTGTFQIPVKKCKDTINLNNFSRRYVANIVTTNQWIEVQQ
jgi:hypothetical protein